MNKSSYKLHLHWYDSMSKVTAHLLEYRGRKNGWAISRDTKVHTAYWAAHHEAKSWGIDWGEEQHRVVNGKPKHTFASLCEDMAGTGIEGDGFVPLDSETLGQLLNERTDLADYCAIVDSEGWVLVGYRRKDGSQWVQPIARVAGTENYAVPHQ